MQQDDGRDDKRLLSAPAGLTIFSDFSIFSFAMSSQA
jgi:hypothetical protein